MASQLLPIITSPDPAIRNRSLDAFCRPASLEQLLAECAELDAFRRQSDNLYERVRALFFLYAIHRFHLPGKPGISLRGLIPFQGHEHLLHRRFEEAIEVFLKHQQAEGPGDGISSALAAAYHRLAFQTLADQVRRSVRSVRGNQWMFRMGHPADQPLRLRSELLARGADGTFPILREQTPVRMDLTHCGWSDIFFLGMDYPEGAKVLNVSIDLGVHGRDTSPKPPVEAYLRVIEEPVLRLTSVDLGATADINNLAEVFDFARDYLGLLKAAVIASGIVPPGVEGSGQSLAELLAHLIGPGHGLEIVSSVNNIPKGSRLAVSTNLLAALVAVCMRATNQAASLTGQLAENERRLVLARALLGEWLGGSGGGWQDSGGVWPGIKLIQGAVTAAGDPESGISRGRLMPTHKVFDRAEISDEARRRLQDSLVLVHGGMAQNVGPILEMVTEKYLLRSEAEWQARQSMLGILDEILGALPQGDILRIGAATTRNFQQPIQTIIPWVSTFFTEQLIERVGAEFGKDFWGFWMLGGMSGGGMGFMFAPEKKALAQKRIQEIMSATKRELSAALPFAMEPVVYDFAINERGTWADLLGGEDALMPPGYYSLTVPPLLRQDMRALSPPRRAELDKFAAACHNKPDLRGMVQTLFDVMLPRAKTDSKAGQLLDELLEQNGFDRAQHEQIRADLKDARIGLAQNRLPANAVIEDVKEGDVFDATGWSGATVPVANVTPSVPLGESSKRETPTGTVGVTDASRRHAPLPFAAFDSQRPASIQRRYLPHWRQAGATYFVTFRLDDALPASVATNILKERDEFLLQQGRAISPERQAEIKEFFREKMEAELDKGHGACVLKDSAIADVVESALRHFDGQRYWLGEYVIMPNHVHAVVRPIMGHALSAILHSWKSFTAHEVRKRSGGEGQLWQHESFDHIVRNEHELERVSAYVQENPVKARLVAGSFRLGHGSSVGGPERDRAATVPVATVTPSVPPGESPKATTPTGTVGVTDASRRHAPLRADYAAIGEAALRNGELAIVTLAAGTGSRWTQGAGVCKALHPFAKLGGRHRTFIETHLAKSRRVGRAMGCPLTHIFTTSYLTHAPTEEFLARQRNYGYDGPLFLSPGKSIGLRLVPTVRDLRFMWEEMPQQMLDQQQQKVRDSLHAALINWARGAGEASDYIDNLPLQCLHPTGHWYEVPNLLRNPDESGLACLLTEQPNLKYLFVHNIDTLGADADPALLGLHIQSGAALTYEVITRRLEDRGGGLARVNGRVRLVEGLAIAREEDEFKLSYYNTLSTWVDIDKLLAAFGLTRTDLTDPDKVTTAVRNLAARMPTYITLKDVKKRWGHGQEDIFPVAQFEKLWGDLSALPEIDSRFVVVPRLRGQQLKDQAQLDGWLRDGSAAHVESLCEWV